MCSAESTPDSNGSSTTTTTTASTTTTTKVPETTRNPNRRSNKPIMEKRRRARINNSLNELKSILLEAMSKDPSRHSKLEKADILELTVTHLKTLHRHHGSTNDINSSRFRAGFVECAAECARFLSTEGYDREISGRLLGHLTKCINSPVMTLDNHTNGHHLDGATINVNTPIISLVPSKLSSGEIAYILPSGLTPQTHIPVSGGSAGSRMQIHPCNPPPMLSPEVPLELTTSSSSTSSLSPNYPIGHHGNLAHPTAISVSAVSSTIHSHHHHHSVYSNHCQPLSLVTPRRDEPDLSCWRPW